MYNIKQCEKRHWCLDNLLLPCSFLRIPNDACHKDRHSPPWTMLMQYRFCYFELDGQTERQPSRPFPVCLCWHTPRRDSSITANFPPPVMICSPTRCSARKTNWFSHQTDGANDAAPDKLPPSSPLQQYPGHSFLDDGFAGCFFYGEERLVLCFVMQSLGLMDLDWISWDLWIWMGFLGTHESGWDFFLGDFDKTGRAFGYGTGFSQARISTLED